MKFVTLGQTSFSSEHRDERLLFEKLVGWRPEQTKIFASFYRHPKRIEKLGLRQGDEAQGNTETLAVDQSSQCRIPRALNSLIIGRPIGLSSGWVGVIKSADNNHNAFVHATRWRPTDGFAAMNSRQTEKKHKHEKGNVDQRITAGRMPDRCGREWPAGGAIH